jgi:membrane protein DedA with SNARE-associated domain
MENEKLIWGLGGFIVGIVMGYLFAIAINKFKWEIRTFVILIGTLLWGFIMIARVLKPELNIGIVFDLIMGGMIGNAVGFNFGSIWKGTFNKNERYVEKDVEQDKP